MPTYHTVFDLGAGPAYSSWRLALAFIICAIALIAWRRLLRAHGAVRHWILRAGILIVAALAVVAATYEPAARGQLRDALDHGTFQTVEGQIIDYSPADPKTHVPEHFTVQGSDASHFTFILRSSSPGFHQLQSNGTPLHKGECVRLAVVGGAIARVDIADHAKTDHRYDTGAGGVWGGTPHSVIARPMRTCNVECYQRRVLNRTDRGSARAYPHETPWLTSAVRRVRHAQSSCCWSAHSRRRVRVHQRDGSDVARLLRLRNDDGLWSVLS